MLIYRLDDKKWTLAFGTYPVLTLSEARRTRDEARKKIAVAVDANDLKKCGEAHGRLNSNEQNWTYADITASAESEIRRLMDCAVHARDH
ncbi:phage integrase family protein [Caballeronia terrestris]|uniref:Phage integrase family protein n=1 Tax=Caballeronia terrestris TaxID=1226301 RepID=A0A158HTI5_9BURK|nr:Arm DNA-binding domain-containing protein [Caballeronia terrestris]SAL47684.1 phage integrase family protein [Caballeronia terrestris]